MNTEMTSNNNGLICLAIDATGPRPDDEILSASIVDAGGRVIYQSMVRPMHLDDWDSGESAITPADVADAPLIGDCMPDIQRVVDSADEVVCYDAGPTLRLLRAAGVEVPQCKVVDVSDCFARTASSMIASSMLRRSTSGMRMLGTVESPWRVRTIREAHADERTRRPFAQGDAVRSVHAGDLLELESLETYDAI